jgi:hypothetical protein
MTVIADLAFPRLTSLAITPSFTPNGSNASRIACA